MTDNLSYVLPMNDNNKNVSHKLEKNSSKEFDLNCFSIILKILITLNLSLGLLFLILGNSYYISFPIVFELLGYCGILNLNECLLHSYICYQVLYLISKLTIIYYLYDEYNTSNIELFYLSTGLIVITGIFNLLAISITYKIIKII